MRSRTSSWIDTRPALLLAILCAALPACMERPTNGDVITGETLGKTLGFSGKHASPNTDIYIQVMAAPDVAGKNDPSDPSNWVTIATATSSSTPEYWQGDDPYYSWAKAGIPVPGKAFAGRWPQGGILRFRAVDENGTLLAHFDQDRRECYIENSGESWDRVGNICKSDLPVAAVVSPSPTPADTQEMPYLSRMAGDCVAGADCVKETMEYYEEIGAPPTLDAFKHEYGFGNPGPLSDEVSAVYFNAGDLGTGREMHCKSKLQLGNPPIRACYVSNYGDGVRDFGGDPQAAVNRAIDGFESGAHHGAFATVAMVYVPPITADNSVRFIVYDEDGKLKYDAQLDSTGYSKAIPHNCISCHGGATYDPATNRVSGASLNPKRKQVRAARFLPFDLDAFEYSTKAGYTRADQEESFRKLNRHVYFAGPSDATVELIDGWYGSGGVHIAGTTADTSFVPGTFARRAVDAKIYRSVVAPYCRACHVSQTGIFSFVDSDDFKDAGGLINVATCGTKSMPHAEVTQRRFWASPARAYLAGYLDSVGSCKP